MARQMHLSVIINLIIFHVLCSLRMVRKSLPVAIALLVAFPANEAIYAAGALEENDYRTCVGELDSAPGCDQLNEPNAARTHLCRGIGFRAQGDSDHAIAEINEAIRLKPNFAMAFCFRGLQYDAEGDQELAIADYNEAIALDPAFLQSAGNNRAVAYFHKKDYNGAVANFSELIVRYPTNRPARVFRGAIYALMGNYHC
jgi:tetratricopeptide (TPR) repeat protein